MLKTKRYFITGLLIILPVFITFYVLYSVFLFIDGVFGKLVNNILLKYFGFVIPGLGFILGLALIIIIGALATNFLGKRLISMSERWLMKFSFIRQVYLPIKQILHYLVSHEKPAFNKVALVEYPSKGIWSLGFVTNEGFGKASEKTGLDLVGVYIPSVPNPLTGYVIFLPRLEVRALDISVEEGMRLIVSGGIISPEKINAGEKGINPE
jgi:uncharacterized membrane protein